MYENENLPQSTPKKPFTSPEIMVLQIYDKVANIEMGVSGVAPDRPH